MSFNDGAGESLRDRLLRETEKAQRIPPMIGGAETPLVRDNLHSIFEMQKKFMILLGQDPSKMGQGVRDEKLSTMAVALADEAFEILRETDWKPWKKPKGVNHSKAIMECIDALHFVIEMLILLGMNSDSTLHLYKEKMAENVNRQMGGY